MAKAGYKRLYLEGPQGGLDTNGSTTKRRAVSPGKLPMDTVTCAKYNEKKTLEHWDSMSASTAPLCPSISSQMSITSQADHELFTADFAIESELCFGMVSYGQVMFLLRN